MSREIMQQALHYLVDLADDLRRIPNDIAQTIAALEAEIAKPEQASTEPPDYVEPPTSDYHNGWEEGFEAAKNLFKEKK